VFSLMTSRTVVYMTRTSEVSSTRLAQRAGERSAEDRGPPQLSTR